MQELEFRRIDTRSHTRLHSYLLERTWLRSKWKSRIAAWCWRLLAKLGAYKPYLETIVTHRYTEAKSKEVFRLLSEALDETLDAGEKVEDQVLILGEESFLELMDDMDPVMSYYMINIDFNYGRHGTTFKFKGVPVAVVPFVKGAAILPRDLFEKVER